jgi:hypothetical protein
LLGESPGCNLDNVLPSKAGVQTALEVLKIQMNFWPTLGSRFSDLQVQWGMYCLKNKSEDLSLSIPLNASSIVSSRHPKFRNSIGMNNLCIYVWEWVILKFLIITFFLTYRESD